MKQGIVKFSKEFVDPYTGLKEWYSYEGPVGELLEGEDVQIAFKHARDQVIAAKAGHPIPGHVNPPAPSTELPVINKAEERLGILIENATTREELMKYKDEAKTPYLADLISVRLSKFVGV